MGYTYNSKELERELEECKKRISELEEAWKELQEIKRELKESEEKFRKIFDSSPNLIALIDSKGIFVDANSSMQEFLGLNPAGKSIYEILPSELAGSRMERIREVIEENKLLSFEDEKDERTFINFLIPLTLEKRYCLVIARETTQTKRLERLLRMINEVNSLIFREKDAEKLLKKSAKLIAAQEHSVWIGFKTNGYLVQVAYSNRLKPHPEKIGADHYCFKTEKALVIRRKEREERCPFYNSFKDHSCLVLPMKDGKEGFIVLHSTRLPSGDEIPMLETLSKDLGFAYKAIELDVARAKAYMQIEENINAFAALVDGIRNPLAIISGTAELSVENDDAKKRLLECVSKIDTIVSKLDKGWVESEKIREFLKRYI